MDCTREKAIEAFRKLQSKLKSGQKPTYTPPGQRKVTTPKEKREQPPQGQESKTPADKLAGRIEKRLEDTTPQAPDPETLQIDTLFKIAEEVLPKKGKNPRDLKVPILNALENEGTYFEAYAQAQAILKESLEPEKLAKAQQFLEQQLQTVLAKKEISAVASKFLKDEKIGISKMLDLTAAEINQQLDDMAQNLADTFELDEQASSKLKTAIQSDFNQRFDKVRANALKALLKTGSKGQQKVIEAKLNRLKNAGGLASPQATEKVVSNVTTQTLKENEISIRELVKKHYLDANKTLADLEMELVAKANYTPDEAKTLLTAIQKELDTRTRSAKEALLKQAFKKAPPRIRRTLTEKLIELSNLGALDSESYRNAIAETYGMAQLDAENGRQIFAMASELQNLSTEKARNLQSARLIGYLDRLTDKSLLRKIATGQSLAMLSSPKTQIRNIAGNFFFGGAEITSKTLAAGADRLINNKNRTILAPNLKFMAGRFKRGWKEAWRDVAEGIDTSPMASKYEIHSNTTFKNKFLLAAEKAVFGTMKAADRAFFEAAYANSLLNEVKIKRIAGQPGRITPEMRASAILDGLYATFQDDSYLADVMVNVKRAVNNNQEFGFGDLISKFTKTPANLVNRSFAYSELGFAKAVYELAKPTFTQSEFNRKSFLLATARAFSGKGVAATGFVLGGLGLAKTTLSDKPEIKALQEERGEIPYSINMTALQRFAFTWDPEMAKEQTGDRWVSGDWAQPIAPELFMGVAIGQGKDYSTARINAIDTITRQSLTRGYEQFMSTRNEEGKPSLIQGAINVALNAPASFVPSPLNAANASTDNVKRNVYDSNPALQALNNVKARTPGLSQTLPKNLTGFGDDRKKYQDNNLFNTFVNPSMTAEIKADPLRDELLRIYDITGETQQAPGLAPKKIKIKKNGQEQEIELSAQQMEDYQAFRGPIKKQLFNALMQDSEYKNLTDDDKAEIFSSIEKDIDLVAKEKVFKHEIGLKDKMKPEYVFLTKGDYEMYSIYLLKRMLTKSLGSMTDDLTNELLQGL